MLARRETASSVLGDDVDAAIGHPDGGLVVDRIREEVLCRTG